MQHTKNNILQGKLLIIIAILALAIVPAFSDQYSQHLFIMVVFFALIAAAWNIVCGFVGELSLGHGVFVGIGGYFSSLLLINLGLSPWLGMIIGAVAAAIFGIIIGYPCFKLKGPYFTLTTIAFAEILRIWVENNENFLDVDIKGAQGILLPQYGNGLATFEFDSKLPYFYIILGMLALTVLVTYLIKSNKIGFYLTAIKSDPDAAESLGIHLAKYKLIAMIISTFIIAFAGTFYAQYFRYIGPTRIFGHDLSVQIALIGLVGGQGSIFGPVIGAAILVPLSEYLSERFGGSLPGFHLFVYGIIMVLVVFYMPKGINNYIVRFVNWIEGKFFRLFKKKKAGGIGGGKSL